MMLLTADHRVAASFIQALRLRIETLTSPSHSQSINWSEKASAGSNYHLIQEASQREREKNRLLTPSKGELEY